MNTIPIEVTCYAGYRGEETPRAIKFESRTIDVREVYDRWLDPTHRYFKLLGDDESLYIIRHDVQCGKWELTFYKAPQG